MSGEGSHVILYRRHDETATAATATNTITTTGTVTTISVKDTVTTVETVAANHS